MCTFMATSLYSPDQLYEVLDQGASLVEVLPKGEHEESPAESHLPKAANIPLRKLEEEARRDAPTLREQGRDRGAPHWRVLTDRRVVERDRAVHRTSAARSGATGSGTAMPVSGVTASPGSSASTPFGAVRERDSHGRHCMLSHQCPNPRVQRDV
jgi:hypothetical protein